MRPEKLTDAGRDRLREIAILQLKIPAAKAVAAELHISTNYVRQLLSVIRRELSNDCSVSRGSFAEQPNSIESTGSE